MYIYIYIYMWENDPFWQIRSEPRREKYEKRKWSRNSERNEPSTSRYHHPARNFATILMAPTVLRVTDLKISNFSWSEPEIINIMICVVPENPGKFGENKKQFFRKIQQKSKIFPWPLGGPWGTLGGPRENFRKFLDFSKILDLFPEFSWIFWYYYY